MKRLLSVILAAVLMLSVYPAAFAEETEERKTGEIEFPVGGFLGNEPVPLKVIDITEDEEADGIDLMADGATQDIYEYLEAQMRAHAGEIMIYPNYNIDQGDFRTILRNVLFNNYDIFVLDTIENLYVIETLGGVYAYSFKPVYYVPEEGEEAAIAMMDTEIEKYLDAAAEIPNDDVVGKMVVIHDLFCKNNEYAKEEYDEELSTNGSIMHNETRLAYWVFKHNRGVCQGNVIALAAIYDALNEQLKQETGVSDDIIETGFCSSDRKMHVWNIVKVDGKWYHIDETWDDPVISYLNEKNELERYETEYARHGWFMRSYNAMTDHLVNNVNDWMYYTKNHEATVICDDAKYESGYLFDVINAQYLDDGQLITYDDGVYKMAVEYIGEDMPFISDSIKTTKIVATDFYFAPGSSTGQICLAFTEIVPVKQIAVTYTQGGIMDNCKTGQFQNTGSSNIVRRGYSQPKRNTYIFYRSTDDLSEPLCRKILLPGSGQ